MELGLIAGFWVGGSTILGSFRTALRTTLPGACRLSSMDFTLGMMLFAAAFGLLPPAPHGAHDGDGFSREYLSGAVCSSENP
jgi:hypothetical protein